jgi:hypothetical protein
MATQTQDLLQGQLHFPGEIRRYIMAGNATFTLVSHKSHQSTHIQSQVRYQGPGQELVYGESGQVESTLSRYSAARAMSLSRTISISAYSSSSVMGTTISSPRLRVRTPIPHPSRVPWFWNLLEQGAHVSNQIDFWHEGRCCVCGRKLTVPESVADGIGPECKGKAMEG